MLAGVVDYSDSGSDSDAIESVSDVSKQTLSCPPKKRKSSVKEDHERRNVKKKALPLPSSIGKMFGGTDGNVTGDASKHQGRTRNFEHVEGNWASFVYIPLIHNDVFVSLHQQVSSFLNSIVGMEEKIHMLLLNECHLTLSRTVAVRHYWMEDMFAMLKQHFCLKSKFYYTFCGLRVYTNDNCTRTFISLKVDSCEELLESVSVVDKVLEAYNLETYYKEKSFHVSVAWCLGDCKKLLEKSIEDSSETRLFTQYVNQPTVNVAERVCVKFGNKVQSIYMKE